MIQRVSTTFVLLALLAAVSAGCKSRGPVPSGDTEAGATPSVSNTETTGAHPGAANPHAGDDPHAGLGMNTPTPTAPKVDDAGMLDVGGIEFEVPSGWKVQAPKSSMRRAQLVAPGSGGDAELIVYYFGPQGAGSTDDNVKRWLNQFTAPGGAPVEDAKVAQQKVGGETATTVDVTGQYTNTMMQGAPGGATKADQRLLAAIVPSSEGPYYFKFLGPSKTVGMQAKAFDGLIQSISPAPDGR